jgi:hypothetical protein
MGTERGVLTMRGEGKGQDLTSETSTVVSRRRWRVPGEDGGIGTAGLSPPRPGHVQKKKQIRGDTRNSCPLQLDEFPGYC